MKRWIFSIVVFSSQPVLLPNPTRCKLYLPFCSPFTVKVDSTNDRMIFIRIVKP
jgi:hypothetical protein